MLDVLCCPDCVSLLIRVSSMSPFSSGEWWLLPFLHSHLRLQQPGQQHSALPRPSRGSHQPSQLHRQEEEQEEGPQELMYGKKKVLLFAI